MPIYEYACRKCGAEIEKLQALSDAPLTDCAECGEPALKRKISAAGFRLSGGGWYETDFKKEGRRNLAGDGGAKSGGSESGSGSEGKSGSGSEGGKSDGGSKSSESKSSKSGGQGASAGGT